MKRIGIILAGGKGTRLSHTGAHKALLTVYDKTLLEHTIERFVSAGVERVFVITDSGSCNDIAPFISERSFSFPVVCVEQEAGESLGAVLARVMHEGDATYIIAGVDLFFEIDPFGLLGRGHEVSLLVDTHTEFNKFAETDIGLALSAFGRILQAGPREPHHNAFFAGLIEAGPGGVASFKGAIAGGKVAEHYVDVVGLFASLSARAVHLPRSLWYDVNTPAALVRAEMLMRKQHAGARPTAVNTASLLPTVSSTSFYYKKERTTGVLIEDGLIERLTQYRIMEEDSTASHHILITDETVNSLYGEAVLGQFLGAGYRMTKFVTPKGELAKQIDVYHSLAKQILSLGIDEHSIIFALGGGAVLNLSGFLAATLYRGIGLIHIPTTFMSMVDVSVSLKQGINDEKGKNMLGAYYQPLLVMIDPSVDMPDELIYHGMAESIKHALGQDEGGFFEYLRAYEGSIQNPEFKRYVIEKTLDLKIELMHEDMFEHKRGIILQYGHEVGHALERLSHFSLTHGEAISIGMRVSAELAHVMHVTGKETVDAHKEIFKKYHLPYTLPPEIDKDAIVQALFFNKKTRGKDLRFALLERVGRIWKIKGEFGIPCPMPLIEEALRRSEVA